MVSEVVQQVLDLIAGGADPPTVLKVARPVMRSGAAPELALNDLFVQWCCAHWREIDCFDKTESVERNQS